MKVLFLDRDGVINHDHGYVYLWENFKLIEGTLKALQNATKKNYKIIIITNQSGIARGFYTEDQFKNLMTNLYNYLQMYSIEILDYFYCPHHPDASLIKYKMKCNCRKPKPGMFLQAKDKYNICLKESVMVGDKITDLEAAREAGIKNLFLVGSDIKDNKIDSFNKYKNLKACMDSIS